MTHEEMTKRFMENHVFAVWDFQCLVKTIKTLSTSENPLIWTPPRISYNSLRLINEIILGEETDILPDGNCASHLDLYIMAMKEVGADTTHIEEFLKNISSGVDLSMLPEPAREFVSVTMQAINTNKLHVVLSVFTYGRELLIPKLFIDILNDLKLEAPLFRYYLERHIEVDSEDHGPAAERLLEESIGNDPIKRAEVEEWKTRSIEARNKLWQSIMME